MYFQVPPDVEKNSHPHATNVCVKFQVLGEIMERSFWSFRERTSYWYWNLNIGIGISIPI